MNKKLIALVLAVLLVFVLLNSLYTVQPKQYVAVRQFGRIVNVVDTPGLKMKVPFIQTIQRISAATILYDIPASDVITKDKKSMISDNYVLWRVTNPTLYIQTLNAIEARAAERIEAAVYNSLKKIISGMTQDEIIAARGERLTQLITDHSLSPTTPTPIFRSTALKSSSPRSKPWISPRTTRPPSSPV